MAVQFTSAGNFRARVRSVKPTGEKHRTTFPGDGGRDGSDDDGRGIRYIVSWRIRVRR